MKIGVRRVAVARSLQIDGGDAGSSPRILKRELVSPEAGAADNFPELDCVRSLIIADVPAAAERRRSVDRVLIAAGANMSEQLKSTWPKLSAATLHSLTHAIPLLLGILAFATLFTTPGTVLFSIIVVLPTAFRVWAVVLSAAASANPQPCRPIPAALDEDFPLYTVIAPLRGEAGVVDQLLTAIERLDYPAEKLDVIVAIEADDPDTRAAITARKHRIPITVILVPAAEPRTKPKALNVALPFARGTFTVVYDAEDRPERNQLRRALKAFRSAGNDLACVQARLCTDTKTSWLARYFTAEYAGHFDIFLPGLAALGLPLPLGGSSNHFRTAALREVGGWDAYNVTEDADLGMRFARFGYRSGVIDSTTFEEAPAGVCHWFGQRTRWFKGWMQTWRVHMREPRQLFRKLGPGGFLTFQLIVGGNALVALAHPVFMAGLVYELIALISRGYDAAIGVRIAVCLVTAALGYCVSATLGWLGLAHRGVRKKFRILFWTPVHWLLLSFAAWRAACQIIIAPHFWKKTEHGLDKTSRHESTIRSLIELERHLTELERSGQLPPIWGDARDGAATPRRHPRAVA
jgi:cellulose synthase/poly-beta-1,6-N-acetylglucosamine synthase-like glycosyltransferase